MGGESYDTCAVLATIDQRCAVPPKICGPHYMLEVANASYMGRVPVRRSGGLCRGLHVVHLSAGDASTRGGDAGVLNICDTKSMEANTKLYERSGIKLRRLFCFSVTTIYYTGTSKIIVLQVQYRKTGRDPLLPPLQRVATRVCTTDGWANMCHVKDVTKSDACPPPPPPYICLRPIATGDVQRVRRHRPP